MTGPFDGSAPSGPQQPLGQTLGQPAAVDTDISATGGGGGVQACPWGCGRPPHPGRFATGCSGPALKHGSRGGRPPLPASPMPALGSVAASALRSLHSYTSRLQAHVSSHEPRLSDLPRIETMLSLIDRAKRMDAEVGVAAEDMQAHMCRVRDIVLTHVLDHRARLAIAADLAAGQYPPSPLELPPPAWSIDDLLDSLRDDASARARVFTVSAMFAELKADAGARRRLLQVLAGDAECAADLVASVTGAAWGGEGDRDVEVVFAGDGEVVRLLIDGEPLTPAGEDEC